MEIFSFVDWWLTRERFTALRETEWLSTIAQSYLFLLTSFSRFVMLETWLVSSPLLVSLFVCAWIQRLEGLTTEDYYPLIEKTKWVSKQNLLTKCNDVIVIASDGSEEVGGEGSPQGELFPLHESAKLPLAIKEKDVEYQFHRLILFSRLLESYPFSQPRIIAEALLDVCPLLRGEIWAAMLGVKVRYV